MLFALVVLTAAPALPAPFDSLEGTLIVEKRSHAVYAPKGSLKPLAKLAADDGNDVMVGVVTLAPNVKRCLIFSPGPSEDPGWFIYAEKQCAKADDSLSPELQLSGEQLIITGNGALYTLQNSNAKFTVRHKLTWNGKAWREVPQPFLYVGEKVKVATKNVVTEEKVASVPLYAEKKVGSEVVVTLAPGAQVEILLAEKGDAEWFLVRTEFGLVGWHHSPGGGIVPDALGLYFHGD
ncbi:MAG: SH3 domain-containing protein [Archangium sp.]